MERENDIALIFGMKGSGKSHLARKLLETESRKISVDVMRETTRGAIVKTLPDALEYLRRVRFGRFSVILRTLDPEEELALLEFLTHGEPDNPPLPDVTAYIDEIDRLCNPSQIPDSIFRLVNYGRHFRVSLIAAARRPNRVHRDLTANADRIFIGKLHEPRDADYLREYVGPELSERVKTLAARQFVSWPDGKIITNDLGAVETIQTPEPTKSEVPAAPEASTSADMSP